MTHSATHQRLLPRRPLAGASIVILAGVAWAVAVIRGAWEVNQTFGFPLDDPWIHLQFAKNLHDYGSFSYFRDEMVTAGSTSPLYTLMLAGGFFVTRDEMMLSYALGVFFLAVAAAMFLLLSRTLFPRQVWLPVIGTALFVLEPRMVWAAGSGMETSMFVAGVLAAFYCHHTGRWTALGGILGLLLWVRPEAVILGGVLLLSSARACLVSGNPADRPAVSSCIRTLVFRLRIPLAIVGLFAGGYVVMNLYLSGSAFPNTFAAKLKYYGVPAAGFPAAFLRFIAGGHLQVAAAFAGVAVLRLLANLIRGKGTPLLPLFLWLLVMFVAYWRNLPFLYQEGRYLMPVIPALLLLSMSGVAEAVDFVWRRLQRKPGPFAGGLSYTIPAVFIVGQFIPAAGAMKSSYAESCKYITDRQVATARWIHDRLPERAVVATHDVGAIGFYSGRRIFDCLGLVSPQMIPQIGNLNALMASLRTSGVTHIAVLRNWFEIVNVNPMFQTSEARPEIMEVFALDSERLHIVPGDAAAMEAEGFQQLHRGNPAAAVQYLNRAVQRDPLSSRALYGLGLALQGSGQPKRAEHSFRSAVALHPEMWNAQVALARLEVMDGRSREGFERLELVRTRQPGIPAVLLLLAHAYEESLGDSIRGRECRAEFEQQRSHAERTP